MRKKFGAMLVLAIFLFSLVPLAFAEDTTTEDTTTEDTTTEDTTTEDTTTEDTTTEDTTTEDTTTEDTETAEEEVAAVEDEVNAVPPAKRLGLCVEKLKQARPNMRPAVAKAVCEKQFNPKALANRAKMLNRKANKMVGRVKDMRGKARVLNAKAKKLAKHRADKIKKLKTFKGKHGKRLAIARGKLDKARANFKKAKNNFMKAKGKLKAARGRFNAAKEAYKACKDDPNSEECLKAKEDIKEAYKDKLLNHVDILKEHFEKVKAKIEGDEYITDEERADRLEWIDDKIAEVEEIKAQIEAAETKEELVAAAKGLNKLWKGSKVKMIGFAGRVVSDRFAGILVQAKQLEVRLDKVMENMEANGKDTSSVDDLVAEFKAKIESAETAFEEAKELFKQMQDAKEGDDEADYKEIRESANAKIKEAKDDLVGARKILRDIVKKIKDADGDEELSSTTTEEAEDIDDAEEEETS